MRKINDMELIAVIPEGPSIVDEITIDERYKRSRSCVNACATLKDPVEDVRELVLSARELVAQIFHNVPFDEEAMDGKLDNLKSTLSKFEGVK